MNSGISLGIFDLVGVIMLVLSGTSFVYLLRLKEKSSSSRMLMWFFLCVSLSSIATILTNIGTIWDWAFAPSQDALLILGGVFLARFAYEYPSKDQPGEARWALAFPVFLASVALIYALSFAIRYIANLPGDLNENPVFYILTPVAIIYVVIVFLRRSIHCSKSPDDTFTAENPPTQRSIHFLTRPKNRPAVALRNYGLALATGLVPVIVLLVKFTLPGVIAVFLFNFSVVIALAALVFTYLTYAPEPVEIAAKLVGISLVTVLLILGFGGIWVYQTIPEIPDHSLVLIFILLVLFSSLLIIVVFPYFFRTALLNPLDKLLQGVTTANDGDLNVQVAVQYDDEIGFLTRSFNRMVRSFKELTDRLENRSLVLEAEVDQRTEELTRTNVKLQKENVERETAEIVLQQQIMYQQALAGCSQALLVPADNADDQQSVLNQALEHLLSGAQASRTYLFRRFDDPELGSCIGMKVEVCAVGIPPHIDNPVNQRFPLSNLPADFAAMLSQGNSYGGPVEQVFASTPNLREAMLTQAPPLLSILLFPVIDREGVWGFIGFDDCLTERQWNTWETGMLGTAAEMIGNTLQRWGIETQLKETLDELETRVVERTDALSQSNLLLSAEIQQRRQAQSDLELRLQIEAKLAAISARLLETSGIYQNIQASLEDLAGIMGAGRIFLVEFEPENVGQVGVFTEWHRPEVQPVTVQIQQYFLESFLNLRERLLHGETIYIQDTTLVRHDLGIDLGLLRERNVQSFVISPIVINQRLRAVLGCSNLSEAAERVQANLRVLELVVGMLKSLLQREELIDSLERQVAERTRQLTAFLDMAMLTDQSQDLADILQLPLRSLSQIVDYDALGIHVVNEKTSSLTLIAQMGIPPDLLELLRKIELDDELAAWLGTIDSSQTLNQPDRGLVFPEPFCLPDYQAYHSIHLRAGNRTLGIMNCYRMADQPFTPFQTMLLTALGDLLGIIIENHNLRLEGQELATIEERQRLAREVHDAVSQAVYSLSLFARSANDALDEGDQEKLAANLDDIEKTALRSMREMRLLLYQLQETRQDQNIEATLENRFRNVENRLGIKTTREIETDIFLPSQIQHEVWRIINEALNNAIKHASAARVNVQISCSDDNLRVSIQDDGVGFDTDDYIPGMGLKNMQARAEALDGLLEITSKPGQGTHILLRIPTACLDSGEGE